MQACYIKKLSPWRETPLNAVSRESFLNPRTVPFFPYFCFNPTSQFLSPAFCPAMWQQKKLPYQVLKWREREKKNQLFGGQKVKYCGLCNTTLTSIREISTLVERQAPPDVYNRFLLERRIWCNITTLCVCIFFRYIEFFFALQFEKKVGLFSAIIGHILQLTSCNW